MLNVAFYLEHANVIMVSVAVLFFIFPSLTESFLLRLSWCWRHRCCRNTVMSSLRKRSHAGCTSIQINSETWDQFY